VLGINASEFVVLLAVAAVVLGPERLPQYAQSLARLVRELRRMAQGAGEQVRRELGPEFDEVDWRKLDPRQYDPRRIVREALADTWDPDDPLGLKEKPVSSGGPTDRRPGRPRSAAAGLNGTGSNGAGPSLSKAVPSTDGGTAGDVEPAPAFDPDAT
jgi:sec-independent protein translocase protein TatB